jgi:ribosomal-protein-alanine N-acetyltransferase
VASAWPERDACVSREATEHDLDEIFAIESLSFPIPWRREFFEGELRQPRRYHRVLESRGTARPRLAGYLFAIDLLDEFHVNKIATHPARRREGLGRRLLADAIDHARRQGARSIILEVRVSNDPAIGFYNSFGFHEIQRRRHYYQDGEDAIVLARPLLDLPFGRG